MTTKQPQPTPPPTEHARPTSPPPPRRDHPEPTSETEYQRRADVSRADLIRHNCSTGDRELDRQLAREEIIRLLVQIGYDRTVDAWLAAGSSDADKE